ncbi:MAG TPA: dihydrofolate reductase family protein [Edaphocola sp.]|nr:dihydrofolate reductase family protein [Edaphocola sp.]
MKKLILFNMLSADGYFEGPQGDIGWHRVDEEVNRFISDQLKTGDTLLFGRKTFEVMENFWPAKEAFDQDAEIAGMMGRYQKIVVSRTRESSGWENTEWIKGNVVTAVEKRKAEKGKAMFVFGSAALSGMLIQYDLIDEFRLMVHPVTVGRGRPLFRIKTDLRLLKTKVFGNGNVLLCYRRSF